MAPKRRAEEVYTEIFSADPLLLKPENQQRYCMELLNNVLENRTVDSIEMDQLFLYDDEKRKELEAGNREQLPPLSDTAKAAYREVYRARTMIADTKIIKELKAVTMLCDPSLTQKRVVGFLGHDEAAAALEEKKSSSTLDKRIRIAAIGHRVQISKLADEALLGEALCFMPALPDAPLFKGINEEIGIRQLGRTRATDSERVAAWGKEVLADLDLAHQRKSHVIVFPEFALPVANGADGNPSIEKVFEQRCEAAKYDHFLFGGSRHEGGYNRGLMLQNYEGKVTEAFWYYKVASARKLGENILGPNQNVTYSHPIKFLLDGQPKLLAICLSLCYDAFDPSTFLSLVSKGKWLKLEKWPTLILVPSFNPSKNFVALLRDLSFLTNSVVVYVNGLHGDAKMFIAGFAISDLMEKPEKLQQDVQDLKNSLEKEQQSIREKSAQRRDADAQRKINYLRMKENALDNLNEKLGRLLSSGGLEHMVTIEHCDECKSNSHVGIAGCPRDILYYNIDPALLVALQRFRVEYIDDSYLPTALRDEPDSAA